MLKLCHRIQVRDFRRRSKRSPRIRPPGPSPTLFPRVLDANRGASGRLQDRHMSMILKIRDIISFIELNGKSYRISSRMFAHQMETIRRRFGTC
jgi:hypothetical protein